MPKKLEATAYHEAGHAVAAIAYKIAIKSVTIVPNDDYLGRVFHSRPLSFLDVFQNHDRSRIENLVRVCYAGGLAEQRFTGRYSRIGCEGDLRCIATLVTVVECEAVTRVKYLAYLMESTRNWVYTPYNWLAIQRVANALIAHRTLSAKSVREMVDGVECKGPEYDVAFKEYADWFCDRAMT